MSLKFQCQACGNYHHAYSYHFTMGKICTRCAGSIRRGEPLELAIRVRRALGMLERIESSAYRVIRDGASGGLLGLALKLKTKALIRHDRILRAAP